MEVLCICILLIILFLGIYLICDENLKNSSTCVLSAIVLLSVSVGYIMNHFNNKPTALDVYQDKTTLKVSYVDGVPVDSVVLFKIE